MIEDINNCFSILQIEFKDKERRIIKEVSFDVIREYNEELGVSLEISNEELNREITEETEITLESSGIVRVFQSPTPITMHNVFQFILNLEKVARQETYYFGNVDTVHIFFERITKRNDIYHVIWGS
jgi:hypothetical protein